MARPGHVWQSPSLRAEYQHNTSHSTNYNSVDQLTGQHLLNPLVTTTSLLSSSRYLDLDYVFFIFLIQSPVCIFSSGSHKFSLLNRTSSI